MNAETLLARPFGTIGELIRLHAAERPHDVALRDDERVVAYHDLDRAMDRVAGAFAREGVRHGEVVAICGRNSIEYAIAFLGALRAGVVSALVPPSATAQSIAAMVRDSGARLVFADADVPGIEVPARRIDLAALAEWMAEPARADAPVAPGDAFNIIYSSGTTGAPKGVVQPHSMRWAHMQRGPAVGYAPGCLTLIATPLYSNTTLVAFFPTLALGGAVAVTAKFEAADYLARAERLRATHTMLVPVQYQRIMARPDFGRHDLSAFRTKLSTSSHFPAALKRDVLDRWPGGLVEYYGMTEGGATCILEAHRHPDKLHTVGQPATGVTLELIDEAGRAVPRGEVGEIVGHSRAMMTGYHNLPGETARAEWHDAQGRRYIRTGDVGRFDEDGFLILIDRRKDLVISGGFNVYPSDLEAVLRAHPDVADAAVVGVPSERWGETPVGFVVAAEGRSLDDEALLQWANARLGKVQRLSALRVVDALPRSAIGKVLKRELREGYLGGAASSSASGASSSSVSRR